MEHVGLIKIVVCTKIIEAILAAKPDIAILVQARTIQHIERNHLPIFTDKIGAE